MTTEYDAFAQPRIYNVCGWTIRKEYFANGPSLFNWIAEAPGQYEEFGRRRDAIAHARAHPTEA